MTVRVFRSNNLRNIFLDAGATGVFPVRSLQAVGNGDGTLGVRDVGREYTNGDAFFEVQNVPFAEFVNGNHQQVGSTELETITRLNSLFVDGVLEQDTVPTITSALALTVAPTDVINYVLEADTATAFRFDSLPATLALSAGQVNRIIGTLSATANIPVTVANLAGSVTDTLVITVDGVGFTNALSTNFDRFEFLEATATSGHPMVRTGGGAGAADAWSMSLWFKPGTSNHGEQTITFFGDGSGQAAARLWYNGSGLSFQYGRRNTNFLRMNSVGSVVTPGSWTHIVVTYDGTATTTAANGFDAFTFYIDGVATAFSSQSSGGGGSTEDLPAVLHRVGRDNGGRYMREDCRVDELSYYASELNQTQVTNLYNSGTPDDLSGFTPSPYSWYRMGDGDTFPTISDNVGSEDFTMNNMSVANFVSDVP
jgi:hypothetical protein